MQEEKNTHSIWKISGGIAFVVLVFVLYLVFKDWFTAGSAAVKMEITQNAVNRMAAGQFLDVESPVKIGQVVHINSVNMPETGFIGIFSPDQWTNKGHEAEKFFGSSGLLPKGVSKNFDIELLEPVKCTGFTVQLFKDVNGDGKFDYAIEGVHGPDGGWMRNPETDPSSPMPIFQDVEVKCR